MSFIEGIGDEVTAFFVVVIVIALASFITFLSSETNFNNFTPIHNRVLPVQQDQVALQQNSTATQEAPSENTVETNSSPPPNSDNPETWSPEERRFYQETFNDNRPSDDISDDTEEPSSSDDGRPPELYPDPTEGETPTAPPVEQNTREESEQPLDPNEIRVRLKYLDDTERTVRCNRGVAIGDFKRDHFPDELARNKVVRLIFCGHLLRDSSTLESYRVLDNSVVHVQVLQAQAASTRTNQGSPPTSDLDLSNLLWPLIFIILFLSWCFYFKHPEFFGMLSLGMLLLFSGSFVIFFSSVRGHL